MDDLPKAEAIERVVVEMRPLVSQFYADAVRHAASIAWCRNVRPVRAPIAAAMINCFLKEESE